MVPIVLFDDRCYLCTKFAGIVSRLARRRLCMIGHYSQIGEELRRGILDSSALEMFWVITKENAYGGRAALLPLVKAIVSSKGSRYSKSGTEEACSQECKTVKAVFIRSASLLTNSKTIPL